MRSTGEVVAYDHNGDRQSADDISLPDNIVGGGVSRSISWEGGFNNGNDFYFTGAVTYFVGSIPVRNDLLFRSVNGGTPTLLISPSRPATVRGGFVAGDRFYLVGDDFRLYAYDFDGNRQNDDDVQIPNSTWMGAVTTGMSVAMENDRLYLCETEDSGFATNALAYTLHDDLPQGLELNASDQVTGTPIVAQTFTATFTATNSLGSNSVDVVFTVAAIVNHNVQIQKHFYRRNYNQSHRIANR